VESGEGIESLQEAPDRLDDSLLWNPVKELKGEYKLQTLFSQTLYVESGEGIESILARPFCMKGCAHVESGEGIERVYNIDGLDHLAPHSGIR